MSVGQPIEAVATDGIVMLFIDSPTARAISDAWEFTYASGGLDDHRPMAQVLFDTKSIKDAAALADRQAGRQGTVAYVALEQPRLRLVGGDA